MQFWVNDKIRVEEKMKMDNILLKTNLPAFQYSIIPWMRHKPGAIKRYLTSRNCRISETLDYVHRKFSISGIKGWITWSSLGLMGRQSTA
jgi:hypothetical protein